MVVAQFPEKSNLEKEIEALYQVLPFATREAGAKALTKEIGYKISVNRLDQILHALRSDPQRWTYTVPFSEKGPPIFADAPRYVCVDIDSQNKPYFNPNEEGQVRAGLTSCVSHVRSMLELEGKAIRYAIPYHEKRKTQRLARTLARNLQRLAEDADELLEALRETDENENGANGAA